MTTKSNKAQKAERYNAWVNALAAASAPQQSDYTYVANEAYIPDETLEILYNTNDLARTIVERIVQDALRKPPQFFVVRQDDSREEIPGIYAQHYAVVEAVAKACMWGRLFGLGAVLLGVDDGKDLREELAPGEVLWIKPVDKRSLRPVAWYSVEDEERMGEPSHWEVRNFQGMTTTTFVVHESRLVFFGGAQTTARTKRERQWCDLSVLQDKTAILRDIDLVWQRVGRGVAESQVSVLKMKNLDQVMGYSEELTTNRARIVDIDKAMGRTIVLDAELEDYEIISAPNLAGMSEVLQQALQRMSSASRMPVTILLGQSPGGLNATGESDARAWYDQVESYQRDILTGALAHIMSLIAAQEPELKFGDGDTIHVEFAPLWEATDKEKAEIDKLRVEATLALLAAGVISIEEARERLIK